MRAASWELQLFVVVLFMTPLFSTASFTVTAPSNYTVLTGDVVVSVTAPKFYNHSIISIVVQLVALNANMAVLSSKPMSAVINNKGVFRCGVIDQAGKYQFQIVDQTQVNGSGILAESNVMDVRWPHVSIDVPSTMETYTSDINAKVEIRGVVCYPREQKYRTWLELVYRPDGANSSSPPSYSHYIQELAMFYRIISRDVKIRCDLLDQPGLYEVVLRASQGSPVRIGVSNTMRINWSDLYSLRSRSASVFPCTEYVDVEFEHPRCILDQDKVRLFGRYKPNVTALASPGGLVYLAEQRVEKGGSRVLRFPCKMFVSNYYGFCFKYVSTSRRGAVADLRTDCIPSFITAGKYRNGNWGQWSPWTSCSVTCGVGSRNRHRFCDSPRPSVGAAFCPGSPIEAGACALQPCPVPATTASPVDVTPVREGCRCGCRMVVNNSETIASSRRHCDTTSVWQLQTQAGHRFRLTFIFLSLVDDEEWVAIRDGQFFSSRMLALGSGKVVPSSVESSSSSALVEFHPTFPGDRSTNSGFVLHVLIIEGTPAPVVLLNSALDEPGIFGSGAHFAAVSLCVLAVLATVVLALLQWIRKAKMPGSTRVSSVGSLRSQTAYLPFHAVTSTTSISDLDLSTKSRRRRRRKKIVSAAVPILSPVSSEGEGGPMCFINTESPQSPDHTIKDEIPQDSMAMAEIPAEPLQSELDDEGGPISRSPLTTRPVRQVALTPGTVRKLPVATVSPQPHRPAELDLSDSPPKKDEKIYEDKEVKAQHRSHHKSRYSRSRSREQPKRQSDSRRRHRPPSDAPSDDSETPEKNRGKAQRRMGINKRHDAHLRDSMATSVSEVSLNPSEPEMDFEYDYYDYGFNAINDVPGSYFGDATLLSWLPPFVPQPPYAEEMFPMQELPTHSQTTASASIPVSSESPNQLPTNRNSLQSSVGTSASNPDPPSQGSAIELDNIDFADDDSSVPNSPTKDTLPKVHGVKPSSRDYNPNVKR